MIADDVIAVHVSFGDEADKCFVKNGNVIIRMCV